MEELIATRAVRYLNYLLTACVVLSSGLYLFYLKSGHPLSRAWSGMNALLLGLFMVSCGVLDRARGGRWSVVLFMVAATVNVAAALLFFL